MATNSKICETMEAVKPCKKCKVIAESGLRCIICDTVSHNGCVKNLKNIEVVDGDWIICYGTAQSEYVPTKENDNAFFDALRTYLAQIR